MIGMIIVIGVMLLMAFSILWSTKKREEAATKAFGTHIEDETGPRDSA